VIYTSTDPCGLQGLNISNKPGFYYKKAGVLALALQPKNQLQQNMFLPVTPEQIAADAN